MEDLSFRGNAADVFIDVVPETVEEAEDLAASIERAVQDETGRSIADLTVEVGPDGVRLTGHCDSYYAKQLAQHAVMRFRAGDRLVNSIEVS